MAKFDPHNPLRWGIIGCGNVSGDFAKAFHYTRTFHRVTGVAARDVKNAQEFIRTCSLAHAKAFDSYSALLESKNIDVVYVGVLNHLHKDLVLEALENGKGVVCEKPIGLNETQTKEMVDKAKDMNVFLMEGYWTRFFPAFLSLRSRLHELGRVNLAMSECGFAAHLPNKMTADFGGGDLMATGCYNIMTVLAVFGGERPLKITAHGQKNELGVDVWSSTVLEFSGDRTATVFNTSRSTTPSSVTVVGEKGYLRIPEALWCPTKLIAKKGNLGQAAVQFDLPLLTNGAVEEQEFRYPNSKGFAYEQDHVFDCLSKGLVESPVMSLDESVTIAAVLTEIRRQLGVKYGADS